MNKNIARHRFIVVWPMVIKEMLYLLWNRWYGMCLKPRENNDAANLQFTVGQNYRFSLKIFTINLSTIK